MLHNIITQHRPHHKRSSRKLSAIYKFTFLVLQCLNSAKTAYFICMHDKICISLQSKLIEERVSLSRKSAGVFLRRTPKKTFSVNFIFIK